MSASTARARQKAGKSLKDWKKELGVSWSWLAGTTGISYPTLLMYGRGRAIPQERLARIATALRIEPTQITN